MQSLIARVTNVGELFTASSDFAISAIQDFESRLADVLNRLETLEVGVESQDQRIAALEAWVGSFGGTGGSG